MKGWREAILKTYVETQAKRQKTQSSTEKTSAKHPAEQPLEGSLNILDLPEEVLRHVFSFLADAEVYFNLRCVSRQLRSYVENYVQLGKSL